ncbi:MAG: PH domain-containing protein [Sphingomicrobium sp.]
MAEGVSGIAELMPVEPGYKHVLRVRAAFFWGAITAGAVFADFTTLRHAPFHGLLSIAISLMAIGILAFLPQRQWRHLRYGLTDRLLQVVRGRFFHRDTIVPLVRVQHLDVSRGPVEKLFGTATLIVHTAGTHNSIVTLPGLDPTRAVEIRDRIREHIRSDFG